MHVELCVAPSFAAEDVNLVGALTNIAEETRKSVGGSDRAVHRLRKLVKGQRLVFLLAQTAHRFGIELAIFSECSRQAGSPLPAW